MDLQERDILGEGRHHTVYIGDDDNKVIKVPKKESGITYKRACDSLGFFQKTFPEFIPETSIIRGQGNVPYYVIQERVSGVLLGEFLRQYRLSDEIREKLHIFMTRAMGVFDQKSISFDIIGTPPPGQIHNTWIGCTNFMVQDGQSDLRFLDLCCQSKSIGRAVILNWLIRLKKHRLYATIKSERTSLLTSLYEI